MALAIGFGLAASQVTGVGASAGASAAASASTDPPPETTAPTDPPPPVDVTDLPALPSGPVHVDPPTVPEGTFLPAPAAPPPAGSFTGPLTPPPVVPLDPSTLHSSSPEFRAELAAIRAARSQQSAPAGSPWWSVASTSDAAALTPVEQAALRAVAAQVEAFVAVIRHGLSLLRGERALHPETGSRPMRPH